MKIKKLPSGNYHTKVYSHTDEAGVRKYESFTDPDRGVVARRAGEFLENREQNRMGDITIKQACERYINARRNVCSITTIEGYEKIVRCNLGSLGSVKVKKLTQEQLQLHIDTLAAGHSAKTVKNVYGFLGAAIRSVRPNVYFKITLPQKRKKFKTLPEPIDIMRMVEGDRIQLAAYMAMWLSLTVSELRGIKKSRNIRGDILTLTHSVVDSRSGAIEKDTMKEEERPRQLRIPGPILEMINKVESDYIVTMTGQAIIKHWERLQEKFDLQPRITFHDLRHVNASVMLMLKVPDKYAMERGGWGTDSTLKAVYQNTFSEERKRVDSAVDSYFFDQMRNILRNSEK